MNQRQVAVGIGNTTVKLGVRQSPGCDPLPAWSALLHFETSEFPSETIQEVLGEEPAAWSVASVHRPAEQRLARWVKEARPRDHYRSLGHRDLPLKVDVEFPERVGMDRLVAAVAANRLRPQSRSVIVVDAGTALTVDAVDVEGVFCGGAILPGFRMTARALARETDQLPLVEAVFPAAAPSVIGRSTVAAIHSGMFWGGVGAIRELVTRFSEHLEKNPQLFVTGGDAKLLASFVHPDARFVPDLVLAGIVWADA